jgi:hypothetical protein
MMTPKIETPRKNKPMIVIAISRVMFHLLREDDITMVISSKGKSS